MQVYLSVSNAPRAGGDPAVGIARHPAGVDVRIGGKRRKTGENRSGNDQSWKQTAAAFY
jgi:hypothetical protein